MMKKILVPVGLIFLTLSCRQEEAPSAEGRELASQVVENFQMEESVSGQKRYYLEGRRAFYYDRSNQIVVLSPHIYFYSSQNVVNSEVDCDSGVIENRTGDLRAYGQVVVKTQDSTVLYTDSLVWFNRRGEIETDARVFIESGEGTVEGKGLISDAQLARIEIKEEITGTTGYSIEAEQED